MAVNSDSVAYGLSQQELDKICSVVSNYDKIDRVILYGSRAMGTNRPNSDIDLVFEGRQLCLRTLMRIDRELDDLMLPYKIDTAILHNIENRELSKHIERVGITLFSNR